jgi:hypothetical protein
MLRHCTFGASARQALTAFFALFLCAAAASSCGRDAVSSTQPAEQAFSDALQKRDAAALEPLLDADFSWITATGVYRSRASVLASLPERAVDRTNDVSVESRPLGSQIVVVQHHGGNAHAMHVWVRRTGGWRLLHVSEVIEGERVVYGGTMIGAASCINPCKTVPFVPANDVERAIIEAWQAQQSGPEQWAAHIPDDNVARTSNGTYTKADRIAVQLERVKAGASVIPSPLTWVRIWEFGDSALMIAQQPRAVGKPFWGSRVFELRNSTWMMAESYHTSIDDHPPY